MFKIPFKTPFNSGDQIVIRIVSTSQSQSHVTALIRVSVSFNSQSSSHSEFDLRTYIRSVSVSQSFIQHNIRIMISALSQNTTQSYISGKAGYTVIESIRVIGTVSKTTNLHGDVDNVKTIRGDSEVAATQQDFEIYEGNTYDLVVSLTSDGQPIPDLTGCTIKWGMMTSPILRDYKLQKDSNGNGITLGNSQFTVHFEPEDTEGLTGGFYHEAELTDALGNVSTVLVGTATIIPTGL